ncbi:MAG: type III-A CRISPR-associated protein Cas10/Csm1 [Leptospiraceae bacterium]|nr:type III-A CRISPR-associated protein Cas10/Csm1 [Leptospiraceae bacterium]
MDEKYALVYASMLHDLGKMSQRIGEKSKYVNDETVKSLLTKGYGYLHALFTQEFFDRKPSDKSFSLETIFQQLGNPLLGGESEDQVSNLASRHHNPTTPYQWLIAEGDRLSSGHDRKSKDEEDELSGREQYLKTRTSSIYELIDIGNGSPPKNEYFLEIQSFHGNSKNQKFPKKKIDLSPKYGEKLNSQYKSLFEDFCKDFDKHILPSLESKPNSLETLYQFLTLCDRYYYSVPSSTIDLPDINLFDHSYLIAAISVALYDFHINTKTFHESAIRDRSIEKFILVQGDLSGIQSYILNFKQEATSGLAKTLRARSIYLQVITKSIENEVLKRLNLPPTSVIMSAGSKFQILAPNIVGVSEKIEKLQTQIDEWLLKRYMGDISFQLDASLNFAPKDLLLNDKKEIPFKDVLKKGSEALEKKKSQKMKSILLKNGKWDTDKFIFSEQYKSYIANGVCNIQGNYPAHKEDEDSKEQKKPMIGNVAFQERNIGKNLPNSNYIVFDEKAREENIGDLPFGNFSLSDSGFFRLIQDPEDLQPSFSFIGHLSKFISENPDSYEKDFCKSCIEYKKQEQGEEKNCSILSDFQNSFKNSNKNPASKSFHCLAQESLRKQKKENSEEMVGKSFLGVLKADVDNLGLIFQKGLSKNQNRKEDYFSISRYSALSKSLNYFFSEYLSEVLKKDYPEIYTVYSGGDDMFLLGPYPILLKFISKFRNDFSEYTCNNPNITFSAGFALQKPRVPISVGARKAEEELENAKENNKNSISLFGISLTWKEFQECLSIQDTLIDYLDTMHEYFSTSMIYRLLRYARMYKNIHINPTNVMYNSYFRYDLGRNLYPKLKEANLDLNRKAKIQELISYIEALFSEEFLGRKKLEFLEVPLQLAMYQSRGGKG